ncbi:hypothetical protein E2C01_002809 [Portunus trituberculatus]|uniref:Uncharacterized protein n=1 Tax=Portunus trituberculatus TaxID=210409 RepID=A0A5B7CKX1_PORTR|nr:hypothetical protein [Portunus trituberculatus]
MKDISGDLIGVLSQRANSSCNDTKPSSDPGWDYTHLMSPTREKGVSGESISKGHKAMGEVMLSKPRHHLLLLHIRPSRHIYY